MMVAVQSLRSLRIVIAGLDRSSPRMMRLAFSMFP
jgi:hypothetical protein